jgi:superfamily II DNA or RNA helicase
VGKQNSNKMQVNEKKLARQEAFIEKWIQRKGRGCFEGVTGFGKTYIAILILKKMNLSKPDRTTIVIVPRIPLKKQWEALLKEHGIKNTKVFVINTAIKIARVCDLLILDELHNYAAPSFIKLFRSCKYKFILGLTATLERNDQRHLMLNRFCPIIDTVTMEEARREGYVSSFQIYNLGIKMNEREQRLYDEVSTKFKNNFKVFGNDFNLAMACASDPVTRNMYADRMKMESEYVKICSINFNRYMQLRKRVVYNLDSKAEALTELLDAFPDRKVVVFSESVNFLIKYQKSYTARPTKIYHSGMTPNARKKCLEQFIANESKILLAARALDEGLDVADIDMVIIVSSTSSKRQDIQRTGRGIRFMEGKDAIVVNLYAADTIDLTWLKSRQEKNIAPKWVYTTKAIIEPNESQEQARDTGFETRFKLT